MGMVALGESLVAAPPPGPRAALRRRRQVAPHQAPEQAPRVGNRQGKQRLGPGGDSYCLRAFLVWRVEAPPRVRGAPSRRSAPRAPGGAGETTRANCAPPRGRGRPRLARCRRALRSSPGCQPLGPSARARCQEGSPRQTMLPGWDDGCGAMRQEHAARRRRRPTRVCAQGRDGRVPSPPALMSAAALPAKTASASHGRRRRRPGPTRTLWEPFVRTPVSSMTRPASGAPRGVTT